MMDILESIDLMAVCGHGKTGLLEGLTRSVNKKIDTRSELSSAQVELGQLVDHMSRTLQDLLNLKDAIETHSKTIDEVAAEIEVSGLAALFLAHYLRKDSSKASMADHFEGRSMSLVQTLAQIRQNDQVKKIQIEQPVQMISSIQNVALVIMPGFIGSIATVLTQLSGKGVSPTEAGEVSHKLQDVINQLK
jgi:hypothetical protein